MDIFDLEIGSKITPAIGLQIANKLGLTYIADRIKIYPYRYKDFIFDGCSCIPDEYMGLLTGCKWKDITYKCCLPHDIQYAYGEIDNKQEKKMADRLFKKNLIKKASMKSWMAECFLFGVKIGGSEKFGMSFSWGFANKEI